MAPEETPNPPETIAEGRYLRFVRDGRWEFVQRRNVTGIVAIAACTPTGHMLLVEQPRRAIGNARTIELPAGLAGDEGDDREALETAAQRELREETGYQADHFQEICLGPPSAGLSSEMITFYRATGLRKVSDELGAGGEEISLHEVPLPHVPRWLTEQVEQGRVIDPKVYVGLWHLTHPST